jgi:AcrR family transcriptional regulator
MKTPAEDGHTAEKPRTVARRRQVLEAASRCFRRYGFHASSMAQISAEAEMSVGHIYRYFTGKEEIIAAIVREDTDEAVAKFDALPTVRADLVRAMTEEANKGIVNAMDPDKAALFLEIRAEAARNPSVAEIVRLADAKVTERLRAALVTAIGRPIDPGELEARVEMFHVIFQGVGLRAVSNAALDRSALADVVKLTISALLQ